MLVVLIATGFASCAARPPAPEIRTVIVRPTIPPFAKTPCRKPEPLPDAALTAKQVATVMARDRNALVECEGRRSAAVAAATSPTED